MNNLNFASDSDLIYHKQMVPVKTCIVGIHSERIFHRMVPILEAMEPEVKSFDWTSECAHALVSVMAQLETAGFAVDGVFVHSSLVLKTEAHT
jgi:hypothetical protein